MRKGGLILFLSILAICAGCSSGGSGGLSGGEGSVSPGHSSPEDAVDGILTALMTGHSTAWCGYFNPSGESECQQDSTEIQLNITGSYSIKGQVIQGTQALVSLTGNLCFHGNATGTTLLQCATDSNPSAGMPPGAGSFAQAYAATANAPSNSLSPVPCIEDDRSWYVNFDILNSTTPTTSPATTTTPNTTPTSTPTTSSATTTPTSTPTTSSATTTPTTLAG
ncbi:MAG: hypothetical protein ACLP6E_04370 [Acidimicrobiales bacterium]